ncbi:hypothetical protein Syun_012433 [Stephania yunnanensis]|uniref:Uncharacterized protein n=1 Tax=Stephania yunnanensis TaxID=152371 RepID=A0AAP0PFB2_9MAGN
MVALLGGAAGMDGLLSNGEPLAAAAATASAPNSSKSPMAAVVHEGGTWRLRRDVFLPQICGNRVNLVKNSFLEEDLELKTSMEGMEWMRMGKGRSEEKRSFWEWNQQRREWAVGREGGDDAIGLGDEALKIGEGGCGGGGGSCDGGGGGGGGGEVVVAVVEGGEVL